MQQAKKWSFKLSKFEQFHIQWYTPFASLLGLTSFCRPGSEQYWFYFIFFFFSDFQRCQVAMKNEDLVMTENLHDKFSYRIMKWILYYFFFLLHFFRGILWQFSSCISVLYYILNEYIEEVYLHVVGYELKYPIQQGKHMM